MSNPPSQREARALLLALLLGFATGQLTASGEPAPPDGPGILTRIALDIAMAAAVLKSVGVSAASAANQT